MYEFLRFNLLLKINTITSALTVADIRFFLYCPIFAIARWWSCSTPFSCLSQRSCKYKEFLFSCLLQRYMYWYKKFIFSCLSQRYCIIQRISFSCYHRDAANKKNSFFMPITEILQIQRIPFSCLSQRSCKHKKNPFSCLSQRSVKAYFTEKKKKLISKCRLLKTLHSMQNVNFSKAVEVMRS